MASKASYHHGDLRAALVDAGLRLLEASESEELSLREVARAVGVSPTAVYRHFPDKDALRLALAHAAYDRLGEAQRSAAEGIHGLGPQFQATGRAYVRFALAHPALFRLMTSAPPPGDMFDVTDAHDDQAARLLMGYATSLAGEGASPEVVRTIAARAWALVHGLAVLMIDGHLPASDAMIDSVVDTEAMGWRTP